MVIEGRPVVALYCWWRRPEGDSLGGTVIAPDFGARVLDVARELAADCRSIEAVAGDEPVSWTWEAAA